jgi:putative sigma-54 modulation protein
MTITMTPKDIQITFVGMEPTEALKDYCRDKIGKYEKLWQEATSIEVFLKENVNARGVKSDFRIDINVYLPRTKVRVEEIGEDMYKNIDKASDVLARRLKRYQERKQYWEGEESWKLLEAQISNEEPEEIDDQHYMYIPKIETRKEITDIENLEELEAVERMELLGYNQMMFKNRKSGNICMIYKREYGGYGLVELNQGL